MMDYTILVSVDFEEILRRRVRVADSRLSCFFSIPIITSVYAVGMGELCCLRQAVVGGSGLYCANN